MFCSNFWLMVLMLALIRVLLFSFLVFGVLGRTLTFSGKVPGSAHQMPSVSSSSRVPILRTSSAALCKPRTSM